MRRRRFLTIFAAASAAALLPARSGQALTRWRGTALGAEAAIYIDHPRAEHIVARALAEIERLEDVFSLYRSGSEISRLNAAGSLSAPSFDMLQCLSLVSRIHRLTSGMFDPTIQPLWALYAHAAREGLGTRPSETEINAALSVVGWDNVRFDPTAVVIPNGGALSLNGIAQGYIADRVADLLRAEGLTGVLIDTGEIAALGRDPRGGAWQVELYAGDPLLRQTVDIVNAAVASSDPLGTVFDAAGAVGHILDPRTGRPVAERWRFVSVSAPQAAVADALSTAFCGMETQAITDALEGSDGARLLQLLAVG